MINQKDIWYEFCMGGGGYDLAPAVIQKAVDMLVASEANRVRGVKAKTAEGMTVESYSEETVSKDVRALLNLKRKFKR
jgi:hypothetical protein